MRKFLPRLSAITFILAGAAFFFAPHLAHAAVLDALTDFFTFGTNIVYGLLGKLLWWVLVPISGLVLNLIGQMIDVALAMSLNKEFYSSLSIEVGWGIIRDICNIFFIFVLVFTGIRTILGLDTGETRRIVVSVIIGAVLINFSLFLTRAAIDVSNIFTAWITQGIIDLSDGTGGVSNSAKSVLQMGNLASQQGSLGTDAFKNWDVSTFASGIALLALNCIAIYVFFKVAFLMLGRLVSLIILLIMSPIGFVGHLVPKLESYAKDWRDELTKACLMTPMFLLLLYITLYLATKFETVLAQFRTPATNALTGSGFGIEHYVLFAVIGMMMLKSLKVAEEYTGAVAGQVGGYIKSAAGLALGGVSAVGGLAGRQVLGRAALAYTQDKEAMGALQARASQGGVSGFIARQQLAVTNKAATSSFDARATSIGGAALGALDPKLAVAGIKLDASKVGKTEAGGFKAQAEEIAKDEKEWAEKNLGKGKAGEANRIKYAETVSKSAWYIGRRAGAKKAGEEISGAAYKAYVKAETEGAQGDAQKIKNQMIDEQIAIENLKNASKTGDADAMNEALEKDRVRIEAAEKKLREDKDNKVAYLAADKIAKEKKILDPRTTEDEVRKLEQEVASLEAEFAKATASMTTAEKDKLGDITKGKVKELVEFEKFVEEHKKNLSEAIAQSDVAAKRQMVDGVNKFIQDERVGKPGTDWDKDTKKFKNPGTGLAARLQEKKKEIQDKKREQDILEGKTPKGKDKNTPPPTDEEPEDEADEAKK